MRKIAIVLITVFFALTAHAAEKNLYSKFKGNSRIRVYLGEVTIEAKDAYVNVNVFRSVFDDVLKKRLNIEFVPVRDIADADVVVTARIKDYTFSKSVLPSFFGAGALVADATAPKSAAKLIVDYKVLKPKSKGVLLVYDSFITDERRPVEHMTGEKAFRHAAAKNINRFLYRAFYKQRKR